MLTISLFSAIYCTNVVQLKIHKQDFTSDSLCLLVEVQQPCVHVGFAFLGHTLSTYSFTVEYVVGFGVHSRTEVTAHHQFDADRTKQLTMTL